MSDSEKIAIAAHLHVLLRRKTGRVTDTEWMAVNPEYAQAVVRFARERAQQDGVPEIALWADRLERAMGGEAADKAPARSLVDAAAQAVREHLHPALDAAVDKSKRYIGGIR